MNSSPELLPREQNADIIKFPVGVEREVLGHLQKLHVDLALQKLSENRDKLSQEFFDSLSFKKGLKESLVKLLEYAYVENIEELFNSEFAKHFKDILSDREVQIAWKVCADNLVEKSRYNDLARLSDIFDVKKESEIAEIDESKETA